MRRSDKIEHHLGVDCRRLMLCLAAGGAALSGQAFAQAPPAGDTPQATEEEIVVTARKREENISDIPESIDAFSAEELDRRGIDSVDDLGRQTPGLVLNRRLDNQPNVVLRGVGSFGNVQGVGFYVDDVQNYTDQTMLLDDLERIEILKGPQGTLYGGSNIGGAVRYVSRTPTYDFGGRFSAETGSDNYHSIYASLNAPLAGDRAALRVSGNSTHYGGYIHNGFLDRSNSEFDEYSVRAQLLLEPTDEFSALITARYREKTGSIFSYARQPSPDEVSYVADSTIVPESEVETTAIVANLNYDFGGAELTSISSYTRQTRSLLFDLDYEPVEFITVATLGGVRPSEVYTQEFRLTSAPSESFDWIVGLYASQADNINSFPNPLFVQIAPLGPDFIIGNDADTSLKSLAAFGAANWHFGPFTLGGGLRVQRMEYDAAVFAAARVPHDPPLNISNSDTTVLPKVSLSYTTEDGTLLYASIANGYEPGRATVTINPVFNYRPETLWAYEIGAKGSLFDVLQYDIAAFYNRYEDRQFETRSFSDLGGQVERIDNIGESDSYGFEAGASLAATENLQIDAGVSYIHARWQDAVFGLEDTSSSTGVFLQDLDGFNVPNTPEWQFNLGATLIQPLGDDMQFEFHANTQYTSEIRWSIPDVPNVDTPAYWVTNARIALGAPSGVWQISARVDNVFDEGYFTEFYPNFFGLPADCAAMCHLGAPGTPRRFTISLGVDF